MPNLSSLDNYFVDEVGSFQDIYRSELNGSFSETGLRAEVSSKILHGAPWQTETPDVATCKKAIAHLQTLFPSATFVGGNDYLVVNKGMFALGPINTNRFIYMNGKMAINVLWVLLANDPYRPGQVGIGAECIEKMAQKKGDGFWGEVLG